LSPLDANKTVLTHHLTAAAIGYLDAAGCKPIETEVPVAGGFIADVASFAYPTPTEVKKLKINHRFGYDSDYQWYGEFHFRYGHLLTTVVEVKASKADFLKDIDCKFNGLYFPAHLTYIAYPAGMIADDELPKGWIGLKCSKDGQKLVKRVGWPHVHAMHPGDISDFIAQVAIRRDHLTRYAFHREWMKKYRARERENNIRYTLGHMVNTLAALLKGSPSPTEQRQIEALIKQCPKYAEKDLEFIKSLATEGK
jgi:hypothetical protein